MRPEAGPPGASVPFGLGIHPITVLPELELSAVLASGGPCGYHAAVMEGQLALDTSTPRPGQAASLEAALGELEANLERASAAAARLGRALKKAHEAARLGAVRDLDRALAEAKDAAATASAGARELDWTFDTSEWLRTGQFITELRDAATAAGLQGVRDVNGELLSFPMIVRAVPKEQSVLMGRKREKKIRPTHLVDLLKQARQKQAAAGFQALVQSLERAYLIQTKGSYGVAVPLKETYDILTIRPGHAREYTLLDFLVDIHLLDKSGPHRSSSSHTLTFPSSTMGKGGRAHQIVTEHGEEKQYAALRFD